MANYLVISLDSDEDEALLDFVPAKDHDHAKARIARIRGDYCQPIDVLSIEELSDTLTRLKSASEADANAALAKMLHDRDPEVPEPELFRCASCDEYGETGDCDYCPECCPGSCSHGDEIGEDHDCFDESEDFS